MGRARALTPALTPALRLRERFLTEVGTLGFPREGIVACRVSLVGDEG